jgi:hypothetical protein
VGNSAAPRQMTVRPGVNCHVAASAAVTTTAAEPGGGLVEHVGEQLKELLPISGHGRGVGAELIEGQVQVGAHGGVDPQPGGDAAKPGCTATSPPADRRSLCDPHHGEPGAVFGTLMPAVTPHSFRTGDSRCLCSAVIARPEHRRGPDQACGLVEGKDGL